MAVLNFPSDIKPLFSGHETFPLRQLWLRKAYTEVAKQGDQASKSIFTDEEAIERFGVGKNMVSSIKHWALACDVIREEKNNLQIGEIGEFLFGKSACDAYLEREASIWLVHWLLAGRATRSATWYTVFNFIQGQSFQPTDIVTMLHEYAEHNKSVRSQTTLVRDVEVCLRCYTSVKIKNANEDSVEPLLSNLGLLSAGTRGLYHFHRGAQISLSDFVFAFALLDYWSRWEKITESSQTTLAFNTIAHEYGSPGRVFKLDENSVSDRLSRISEITSRYLEWTDSYGVRQVTKAGSEPIDIIKMRILREAYAK